MNMMQGFVKLPLTVVATALFASTVENVGGIDSLNLKLRGRWWEPKKTKKIRNQEEPLPCIQHAEKLFGDEEAVVARGDDKEADDLKKKIEGAYDRLRLQVIDNRNTINIKDHFGQWFHSGDSENISYWQSLNSEIGQLDGYDVFTSSRIDAFVRGLRLSMTKGAEVAENFGKDLVTQTVARLVEKLNKRPQFSATAPDAGVSTDIAGAEQRFPAQDDVRKSLIGLPYKVWNCIFLDNLVDDGSLRDVVALQQTCSGLGNVIDVHKRAIVDLAYLQLKSKISRIYPEIGQCRLETFQNIRTELSTLINDISESDFVNHVKTNVNVYRKDIEAVVAFQEITNDIVRDGSLYNEYRGKLCYEVLPALARFSKAYLIDIKKAPTTENANTRYAELFHLRMLV